MFFGIKSHKNFAFAFFSLDSSLKFSNTKNVVHQQRKAQIKER
jgi:hypothetical protein